MVTGTRLYRFILLIALLLFMASVFVFFLFDGKMTGPFLMLAFVALAISVRGFSAFRGFSYPLWIFAAVTMAMYYPAWFTDIGNFKTQRLIVPLLQIIMFGMGSQMSLKDFEGVVKMPKGVLVGVLCQFMIMPLVGISLATTFGFPHEIAVGIILVGCSPSGLASNVMVFLARANLPLSITLTTVATLLSPFITPTLMRLLAGQFIEINIWSMMADIFNMTILPVVAGLTFNLLAYGNAPKLNRKIIQITVFALIILLKNVIGFRFSNFLSVDFLYMVLKNLFWFSVLPVSAGFVFKSLSMNRKEMLDKVLSFISMLGIAVIIVIITAAGRDNLLVVGLMLLVACLLHNVFGYALGYGITRLIGLPVNDCRTIALEVGMQNGGLASGLALQMGKAATVGLAPAIFGPLMNITGSSLATWWRRNQDNLSMVYEAEK